MRFSVVSPNESFRGMSYSEWIAAWSNWLFSENPDTYDGSDMLMLRGNINYKSTGGNEGPKYVDPHGIYDKTGKKGEEIFEDTAIFIPIVNTISLMGDIYEGKKLDSPEKLRQASKRDTYRGGPMWATIMEKGEKRSHKLVDNLLDFRVETSLFKLIIPENSLLVDKTDTPCKPGIYDAVSVGYFLIVKSLGSSSYRLNFGGRGIGSYYTNTVYDLTVEGKRNIQARDKSNPSVTFQQAWP